MQKKRLVVIGGGAAGFFCAVNASAMAPQLEVILLEKSSKLLSKVKVSGGGRCNLTHACNSIAEMIKKYPRGGMYLKKAFHLFFTTDTINWFKQRGVDLKTEADGRMFPVSDNSQTIIDCLLTEASKNNVEIRMNAEVREVISGQMKDNSKALVGNANHFILTLNNQKIITTDYLCIASGGYPKSSQFQWITQLGHTISTPVPSLFTFNLPKHPITSLMGVVAENVQVKISGTKLQQQGPLLITHWGFSGPAILKLSAWGATVLAEKNYHYQVVVNWLPAFHENSMLEKLKALRFNLATQKIINRNPFLLPARLWEFLLSSAEIPADMRWAELPAKAQNKLAKILCAYEVEVNGKTTYK